MSLKVAYLINQYPKVSHSFIRREIQGVEAAGIPVLRFAMRDCTAELVDEADRQELEKTRYLLSAGAVGLATALIQVGFSRPIAFLQTLKLACKLGLTCERGFLYHLIYFAEACLLLGWLQEAEVTHLHAHFGTNSTTVAMLCQALGGPSYSFTVHGPEEFDKVKAIALPEKIDRAAFVVAISSYGKSQLYRWCAQAQWSKIHVVHCGLDQLFLNQPPTPIASEARLTCVGRLCEQKGQLLLLEAAHALVCEGHDFKLVLVGDGPMRPQVEALIDRYQLHNHVEITGWADSDQVRQQLLSARAMVLPSFAEGLPVVVMEALALQRPVISTYVAGIPELVEPGTCGWLIPPGSIEALIGAMRSALTVSPESLAAMGAAGAARVQQEHSIAIEASKLAGLLRLSAERSKQAAVQPARQVAYANLRSGNN